MKRIIILSGIILCIVTLAVSINQPKKQSAHTGESIKGAKTQPEKTPTPVPSSFEIPQKKMVYQSYNNCGPATLSMALSYWNKDVSQEVLGDKLRPYQIRDGNNDDKSVTFDEFVQEVQKNKLIAYHRPNGSIELLKKLTSNGFPVMVRTWLHPGEDIGHFRLVRGYDQTKQEIIQDDSYQGSNLRFSYRTFSEMWKPFNYEYVVITDKEHDALLRSLLGSNLNEKIAWEQAKTRAQEEQPQEGQIPYALFNQAVADYHLGNFEETVQIYEQIKRQLPSRMLWYQIEPIQALAKTNNDDEALEVIDSILSHNNQAFTELYLIKGDIFKKQHKMNEAKAAYELAVFYNKHNQQAKDALQSIQ